MLPLLVGAELVSSLLRGPLGKILEAYVGDLELRRKLQAEIETALVGAMSRSSELGAGIVAQEVRSEHLVTWSWRPVLMLVLTGFLILTGFVLPIADMISGHMVRFQPRWSALPPGFWDFLTIGMGGYIGGRSLEKIAGQVFGATAGKRTRRRA